MVRHPLHNMCADHELQSKPKHVSENQLLAAAAAASIARTLRLH